MENTNARPHSSYMYALPDSPVTLENFDRESPRVCTVKIKKP